MNRRTFAIAGIIIVAVGILASSTLFTVDQASQALVLQFGEPKRVVQEPGLKYKLPFVQDVIYYEKRVLNLDPPTESVILADQKPLLVTAFARYKVVDPLRFYQTVRSESVLRDRLSRIINAAVRGVLGNVTLSMVLSQERHDIMSTIHKDVNVEAKRFGIELVDVRIVRADLPDETSQAVYERMRTERQREAAEFRAQGFERAQQIRSTADREATVIRAEAEKEAEILRGQGDGEKTRILAEAFGQDQEFFSFYRSMLAYSHALGRDDTTLVLSPDGDFFRYFGAISGVPAKGTK